MSANVAGAATLAALQDVARGVYERADEIEAQRQVPADIHAEIRDAGLFRALVPESHGGDPLDRLEILTAIEELARADGSVAWTSTLGLQSPCLLAMLPRETFDAIYADGPDVTLGGASGPQGTARRVDGGFVVEGKWAFVSGCDNWDYLFANCRVVDAEGTATTSAGRPDERAMLVGRDQVEILDTWHTLGLRGTGSKHMRIDGQFVPEAYSFDLLRGRQNVETSYPYPFIEFAHHLATVAIGIAQGALDELIESAAERTRAFAGSSIAATATVQQRIGRCETALRGAREMMRRQAEEPLTEDDRADLVPPLVQRWSANTWAVEICAEVIDACFNAFGAQGVYDGSRLQRRLRDVKTIYQHTAFNEVSVTRHGAVLFGEDVPAWF